MWSPHKKCFFSWQKPELEYIQRYARSFVYLLPPLQKHWWNVLPRRKPSWGVQLQERAKRLNEMSSPFLTNLDKSVLDRDNKDPGGQSGAGGGKPIRDQANEANQIRNDDAFPLRFPYKVGPSLSRYYREVRKRYLRALWVLRRLQIDLQNYFSRVWN